jgi:hypothetical protein
MFLRVLGTRCHNPEDNNMNNYRNGNLKNFTAINLQNALIKYGSVDLSSNASVHLCIRKAPG